MVLGFASTLLRISGDYFLLRGADSTHGMPYLRLLSRMLDYTPSIDKVKYHSRLSYMAFEELRALQHNKNELQALLHTDTASQFLSNLAEIPNIAEILLEIHGPALVENQELALLAELSKRVVSREALQWNLPFLLLLHIRRSISREGGNFAFPESFSMVGLISQAILQMDIPLRQHNDRDYGATRRADPDDILWCIGLSVRNTLRAEQNSESRRYLQFIIDASTANRTPPEGLDEDEIDRWQSNEVNWVQKATPLRAQALHLLNISLGEPCPPKLRFPAGNSGVEQLTCFSSSTRVMKEYML